MEKINNFKQESLLTVKQLSEFLQVSPKTLYSWAELRTIPHIKLNGCLRFVFADIEKWVESCKKDTESGYNPFAQTSRCPNKGGDK